MGRSEFTAVQANGNFWAVATRNEVLLSKDGGATWKQTGLASFVTAIKGLTITPEGQVIVASREGAFRASDSGSWEHLVNGLPDKNISSVAYDEAGKRLLATSLATGVVFESKDGGSKWRRGPDSGYPLRGISVVHGHYFAATPFDGVISQPESENRSAADMGGQQ